MARMRSSTSRILVAFAAATLIAAACTAASGGADANATTAVSGSTQASGTGVTPAGATSPSSPGTQQTQLEMARDHLKHLVFIVQENRSFDHYFGTFPGADGFPMRNGRINVCIPDPIAGHCVRPFHSKSQLQQGGPHDEPASKADVNGGRMDGFVSTVIAGHEYCADHRRSEERRVGKECISAWSAYE